MEFEGAEGGASLGISRVPKAAQRKASFWAMSRFPCSLRSTGTILPGKFPAKLTFAFPDPWLVKWVMKIDSPVIARLPADSSLPITPLSASVPSPIRDANWMPSCSIIIVPASPMTVSPGSSSTSTNCRSSPKIS